MYRETIFSFRLLFYHSRETALLYDPKVSSAFNKQRVAAVVSHELAHQWFGDLVTPSWWTDLWLNEGFASYLENLGVDAVSFPRRSYHRRKYCYALAIWKFFWVINSNSHALFSCKVEKDWKMMEQFIINDLQSVFSLDYLESSHPISIPVGHPDEINEIFDRISYNKGKWIGTIFKGRKFSYALKAIGDL